MQKRVTREHLVTVTILVGLLVIVGLLMATQEPDRCPNGELRTGFSCKTGTDIDTPSPLP